MPDYTLYLCNVYKVSLTGNEDKYVSLLWSKAFDKADIILEKRDLRGHSKVSSYVSPLHNRRKHREMIEPSKPLPEAKRTNLR